MIDYRHLDALVAVISHDGFDRAATALGITQSAVSQRIKHLEMRLGQPVLIRSRPLRPTAAGQRLIRHHRQVGALESDLRQALLGRQDFERVAVAINADSLETWFPAVQAAAFHQDGLLLDLQVEDQDRTVDRLRAGTVLACVSAAREPTQGCAVRTLGTMRYVAVASADFRDRHFPDGVTRAALRRAPAVTFGRDDALQSRFLARHFGLGPGDYPHHTVPSAQGFITTALLGIGYALVPELQARTHLDSGALVVVGAQEELVALYWHYWNLDSAVIATLSTHARREAARALLPAPIADPDTAPFVCRGQ